MSISQSALIRLILAIIVALALLLVFQNRSEISYHVCSGIEMAADRSRGRSMITKTFSQVPALEDMSHDNDQAWSSILIPPNDGFISVKHNETLDLNLGISMFHALHCLSLIRAMLQDKSPEEPAATHHHQSRGGHHDDSKAEHFLHETHMPHCLMYIAQSIMCAGDSTIEPPWLRTDSAGNIVMQGVDGLGIQHQCKDTSLLWDVVRGANKEAIPLWDWKVGDTVESVFGDTSG